MDTDTHKNADSSKIRTVWKSETFFTISSSGRQGVGVVLRRWLGSGVTLYGRFIWSNIQLMAAIRIGFDGSFHQFYCFTSVSCVDRTQSLLSPPWSPSLAQASPRAAIYPEMRIIISIVSKHKWIVISPSSWDLNLLIYCEVSRKPSVQKLPKFLAANIDGRTLWHMCTAVLQQ